MPGRGRGGSRGRGDIRSHMVPRNGQHWGAIRNINRARANRSNPIQAGPSTRATTRAATPPIQEDEWDPMDINFEDLFDGLDDPAALTMGSGASGGPGATVGETQQIIPALRDPPYTRVFEHYSTYLLRNSTSQTWVRGPVTTTTATMDTVWTDFQCLPDHIMGFYMDDRDLSTIVGAGTRTMKIVSAGWEVTASNVYQNQQVGGTDLRYANYNGADPRIYQVSDNAVMYPYWRLGWQPLISPTSPTTPTLTDVSTTNILYSIDNSRFDPTTACRVQFGYGRQGLGSYIMPTAEPIHTRVFEYRNMDASPATGLLGFKRNMLTWSGEINFPTPYIDSGPYTSAMPKVTSFSDTQKKPVVSYHPEVVVTGANTQQPFGRKPPVGDVVNCGPLNFPHKEATTIEQQRNFLLTFPVGPMEGAPYAMVESEVQDVKYANKGNRPWMAKLQDILTPDGLETDYTVEIVIKTRMEMEMSTHALSLGRRAITLNADGTFSAQTGRFLHNYGSNNFSCVHMSGTAAGSGSDYVFTPRDSHVSHDLFNLLTPTTAVSPGTGGSVFRKEAFSTMNSLKMDGNAFTAIGTREGDEVVDAINEFKKKCTSKSKM